MPAPRSLLVSPLRYPGGKSWLVPTTRRWLLGSQTRLLVEPFVGGGSVSLAMVAEGVVPRAHLVELDEQVARFWMVVLSPGAAVLAERVVGFHLSEHSVRRELARTDGDDVDHAFRALLRNRVSRAGLMTETSGLLRHGEDGKGLLSRWYPSTLAKRILTASALRDRLTIEHGDGLDAAARYAHDDAVAFYLDPPYTGGAGSPGARLYRHTELDHGRLFALVGDVAGDVLLTYEDHPRVRAWASDHQLEARRIPMRTTHHRRATELLIGRDLRRLSVRAAAAGRPRHSDRLSRRNDPVEPVGMTARKQPDGQALVPIAEAAERLAVSRRTVERLIVDGELERVRHEGRAYVNADSLAAVQRRRSQQTTPRDFAGGAVAALTASVEALTEAVRRDRAELLQALGDREQLRMDLARATAELAAEKALRLRLEAELAVSASALQLTSTAPRRLG